MPVQFSSKLQSLLIPSTRVVVFTGAGISAESGVPTFRGQNGLWNEFRVEDLATPQAFAAHPRRVWEWYSWRRELISKIEPNPGHLAWRSLKGSFRTFAWSPKMWMACMAEPETRAFSSCTVTFGKCVVSLAGFAGWIFSRFCLRCLRVVSVVAC